MEEQRGPSNRHLTAEINFAIVATLVVRGAVRN